MEEQKIEKDIEKKVEEKVEKLVEDKCSNWGKKHKKNHVDSGSAGFIYFAGFIGAAVYFIGQAETFWTGVLGFLQALVWPAFAVYHLLSFLYQ